MLLVLMVDKQRDYVAEVVVALVMLVVMAFLPVTVGGLVKRKTWLFLY